MRFLVESCHVLVQREGEEKERQNRANKENAEVHELDPLDGGDEAREQVREQRHWQEHQQEDDEERNDHQIHLEGCKRQRDHRSQQRFYFYLQFQKKKKGEEVAWVCVSTNTHRSGIMCGVDYSPRLMRSPAARNVFIASAFPSPDSMHVANGATSSSAAAESIILRAYITTRRPSFHRS